VAGPDTRRLGPSILALPVAGLDHLAACVVALTGTLGEPPPDRPFAGHVTLARARGGGRRGGRGGGRIGGPAGGGTALSAAFSAEWEVHEVTLVSSTMHPQGARYEIVSGYELA
jgi:2'-5' RNA ligase